MSPSSHAAAQGSRPATLRQLATVLTTMADEEDHPPSGARKITTDRMQALLRGHSISDLTGQDFASLLPGLAQAIDGLQIPEDRRSLFVSTALFWEHEIPGHGLTIAQFVTNHFPIGVNFRSGNPRALTFELVGTEFFWRSTNDVVLLKAGSRLFLRTIRNDVTTLPKGRWLHQLLDDHFNGGPVPSMLDQIKQAVRRSPLITIPLHVALCTRGRSEWAWRYNWANMAIEGLVATLAYAIAFRLNGNAGLANQLTPLLRRWDSDILPLGADDRTKTTYYLK